MFAQCLHNVCSMFAQCLLMFAQCLLLGCSMFFCLHSIVRIPEKFDVILGHIHGKN